MTLPSPIPSTVFTDGELTNESKWYNRIFVVINSLITLVGNLLPTITAWAAVGASNVTATTSTWTVIPLTSTTVDSGSVGITSNAYVVPASGVYEVAASMISAAFSTSTTRRGCAVGQNGTANTASQNQPVVAAFASSCRISSAMVVIPCTAGDLLTAMGWQDTGGNLVFNGAALSVRRVY